MKSLVIVALLLALIAGYNCANEEEEFIESCKLESKTWNMFVNHLGSKDIRDRYFNDWYYTRATRRVRGGRVNKDKCPDEVDGEKLVSMEDPFEYMCIEEKSFDDYLKTCTNDLIRKKLKYELTMSRERRIRLGARYFCPNSVQAWDPARTEELANKLMLNFKEACAKDAVYDFIFSKYFKIWEKYDFLDQSTVKLVGFDYTNAMNTWSDYCTGSIDKCCGEQINLEQARREGHLKAAQVYLDVASRLSVKKNQKKFLEQIKKVFQKELDKQKKDKSESTQKALKLISDKLASLK